jgi:hypothetical protein
MDESKHNIDVTKDQKDLLWGLHQEYLSQARHAEMLRTSSVSFMLVIASALITVITFDDKLNRFDLPLTIIVSFLGLITALFSGSYAELHFRNRERAKQVLTHLDSLFFADRAPATLAQLKAAADNAHYRFRWIRKITGSTHLFWLVLPVLVFIVGVFLTYLALSDVSSVSP